MGKKRRDREGQIKGRERGIIGKREKEGKEMEKKNE